MSEANIASTQSGRVEGREKEGVLLFAGIPYAAPPVDDLRFKAAQPHPAWDGVRPAKKFGPAAPQIASGGMTDAVPVRWDEDCLTLNVTTPALDDAGRAVLVWIHGGGYRTGQGAIPWYNGARFATNGNIVVVSINYRMGALGFADLSRFGDEYATSGCNGTLDQVTALEWVRDNIAAFGGDPTKVTIAGESAGGFSVGTMLASPLAEGLFHRAIPQSGAAHHTLTAEQGQQVTDVFLEALDTDNLVGLHGASVDDVLAAQTSVDKHYSSGAGLRNKLGTSVSPLYPVVGNRVLPELALDAVRAGRGANVDVMTGSNRDETTLFAYGKVTAERLVAVAESLGGPNALATYRGTRPDADDEALMYALTTDHMFRIPAIRLAEARWDHGGKTWLYQFNWESRIEGLRATHSLEIPFAFDNLHQGGVDAFIGPGPVPQHVADVMHAAWINFINDGDPGWDRYEADRRTTMFFDNASGPVDDPDADERRVWDGVR